MQEKLSLSIGCFGSNGSSRGLARFPATRPVAPVVLCRKREHGRPIVDILWLLSTWLLTISSALLCSGVRELTLIWCFNLGCCVFSFQARRALRRYSPRTGWVGRCRRVGRRRVTRHRRSNRAGPPRWTLVQQMHSPQRRRFCGGGPRRQAKNLLTGLRLFPCSETKHGLLSS